MIYFDGCVPDSATASHGGYATPTTEGLLKKLSYWARIREGLWTFMHFPFHLALVILVEGTSQFVLWRKVTQTIRFVFACLPLPLLTASADTPRAGSPTSTSSHTPPSPNPRTTHEPSPWRSRPRPKKSSSNFHHVSRAPSRNPLKRCKRSGALCTTRPSSWRASAHCLPW